MSTTTINRYLGSCPEAECRVPPGAKVLEMKYCEVCGKPFTRPISPTIPETCHERDAGAYRNGRAMHFSSEFEVTRRRDHGKRFCKACCGRSLEPDLAAQEAYKQQLPDERQEHHDRVYQMPRYDRAPMGRETSAHLVSQKQQRAVRIPYGEMIARAALTRQAITLAFAENGQLSAEQLQALIPNCYGLSEIHSRLKGLSVYVKLVRRVRREGIRGPGMGVYELDPIDTIQ